MMSAVEFLHKGLRLLQKDAKMASRLGHDWQFEDRAILYVFDCLCIPVPIVIQTNGNKHKT